MQTVGAYETKTHFSALLEQVEKGEHVLITKHGHPVAKLILSNQADKGKSRLAMVKLQAFSQTNTLKGLDWKILRDEERR